MAEASRSGGWPLQAWQNPAFIVGVSFVLLLTVASALPWVASWQETADLYVLFKARPMRATPENVVMVPIDGRAKRRLYLPPAASDAERCTDVRLDVAPKDYRNPDPPDVLTRWPRCLHARVLDALAVGQPEAIVMDISFRPRSDPSGLYAQQDRELAAAMRRFGRVVLARKISSEDRADERLQPIAEPIEAAALAVAPFLLFGDHMQRADKFCAFVEDSGWTGPCMPAVAHQVAALGAYTDLRALLFAGDAKHADLLPVRVETLVAAGALQAPVSLIRHLALSDAKTAQQLRSLNGIAAPDSERRLRALTDIYLGSPTRYFNFYGKPGEFTTLRYEALATAGAQTVVPGSLRGKTVFIGFAEYGRQEPIEHFMTPLGVMSGVELAAIAYANLQDGSSLHAASGWLRTAIVLLLGLGCLAACVILRKPGHALVACLLLAGGYCALAFGAFHQYAMAFPLVIPIAVTAGTFVLFDRTAARGEAAWNRNQYARSEEDRAHLERVMTDLLPPVARRRVIEHRQRLPEILASGPGACINTDLEGSTQFAEGRPSDEVRLAMKDYFHLLDVVLAEHGVLTSDYTGDGTMAVWVVDKADPATVRASVCEAALRLAFVAREFRLSRRHKQPDAEYFETRIGVCYGDLEVGMLGDAPHGAYRAIGNVPNTATALQNFNKVVRTRVLVTAEVIDGLQKNFLSRELGDFILPKKKAPTRIYELMLPDPDARDAQTTLCRQFAEALDAYRRGRYEHAMALFRSLAPDGPAEYYYKLCMDGRHHAREPIVVRPGDVTWARRAQSRRRVKPHKLGAL